MVTELCKANSSEGGLPIVVLAQRDKVAMDAELLKHLPPARRMGSRIICRSRAEGLGCRVWLLACGLWIRPPQVNNGNAVRILSLEGG